MFVESGANSWCNSWNVEVFSFLGYLANRKLFLYAKEENMQRVNSCTKSGCKVLQHIHIFHKQKNGATEALNVCKSPLNNIRIYCLYSWTLVTTTTHISACDVGLLKPSLFTKSSVKITLMFSELGEVGMRPVLWESLLLVMRLGPQVGGF